MSHKLIDPVKVGREGGEKTLKNYGKEHFSKAAKMSHASRAKNDPDYGKRQAALMQRARMAKYHERQVKEQKWIAVELGERLKIASDTSESSKFFNKLLGQG